MLRKLYEREFGPLPSANGLDKKTTLPEKPAPQPQKPAEDKSKRNNKYYEDDLADDFFDDVPQLKDEPAPSKLKNKVEQEVQDIFDTSKDMHKDEPTTHSKQPAAALESEQDDDDEDQSPEATKKAIEE